MPRKKRKPVSFDAMVKYFIRYYEIPTKPDIDAILERMDRLEKLIRVNAAVQAGDAGSARPRKTGKGSGAATASDRVFDIIRQAQGGIRFSEIRDKTGFEEKKLRNIIYRLHSMGRIKRLERGIYAI